MENEIMNEGNVMEKGIEVIEPVKAKSGIGAGKALLIGAGVVALAVGAVKLVGRLTKRKANEGNAAGDDEFVEVTD